VTISRTFPWTPFGGESPETDMGETGTQPRTGYTKTPVTTLKSVYHSETLTRTMGRGGDALRQTAHALRQ